MEQDNYSDLTRLDRMERRLGALKDAEAIRNLKARYTALCDAQYDANALAMLLTEDMLWESPDAGRFEVREAIRGFLPRERRRLLQMRWHTEIKKSLSFDGPKWDCTGAYLRPCWVPGDWLDRIGVISGIAWLEERRCW